MRSRIHTLSHHFSLTLAEPRGDQAVDTRKWGGELRGQRECFGAKTSVRRGGVSNVSQKCEIPGFDELFNDGGYLLA